MKKCHIGTILVQVVPEGYIYKIKLVALVLKHISSTYSPTQYNLGPVAKGAEYGCYGHISMFHVIKICYNIYTLSANLIPIPPIDVSK